MILAPLLSALLPLSVAALPPPQVRVYNPHRSNATRSTMNRRAAARAALRYCRQHPRAAKCRGKPRR